MKCLILALVLSCAAPLFAADGCKKISGQFEDMAVPPGQGHCPAGAEVCTAGRMRGSMNGAYQFVMTESVPSGPRGGTSTVNFFTGQIAVSLQLKHSVNGIETGTVDRAEGGFVSLITWTDGARGQIRLRGQLDSASGRTSGDYAGTICIAK